MTDKQAVTNKHPQKTLNYTVLIKIGAKTTVPLTLNTPWKQITNQGKTVFWSLWWLTLALKVWLAVFFPITGDEAFFNVWSWFPQWGYYDHPPMVGWWLWVMNQMGHAPWVLRLPTVLLTSVVALGLVHLVQQVLAIQQPAVQPTTPAQTQAGAQQSDLAWWLGGVYLSLPVSWYGVFITTDTPLIYALSVALYAYVRAWQWGSATGLGDTSVSNSGVTRAAQATPWPALGWVALAGTALGLGFLSKYFAVLMGLGFATHLLWQRRWLWLAVLVAAALPWAGINLAYNAHNCWNNVMFNLINRHGDAALGWRNLLLYLGTLAYVLGPWLLWQLARARIAFTTLPAQGTAVLAAVGLPFAVFLLLSLEKTIGLHWLLGFVPGTVLLLAWVAQCNMPRLVLLNLTLGLPHLLLFALLLHGPASLWGQGSFAKSVLFHRELPHMLRTLSQGLPPGAVLASTAYSPAALMSYHLGTVVPVFGPGKYHARNDDTFVDWRTMQGKNFRIVAKEQDIDPELYQGILSNIKVQQLTIQGLRFTVVDGDNFNYSAFRERHLAAAEQRYYRIPSWLPTLGCEFKTRYGF